MSSRAVNQSSASIRDESLRQRQLNRRVMARRPRRIQPLVIIAVVLSIGLFFIGIILTIVAYWPGSSTIGSDPLKIVGPVILSIGVVCFIVSLAFIYFMSARNQQKWAKTISERTQSRSTLGGISMISAGGIGRQPSIDAKPGRGILKKTPSTSTNRGSDLGDDSGLANTQTSVNGSYERDSDSSLGSAGLPTGFRIESLPDPGQARRAPRGSANGPIEHSSDTEQGSTVPQPVRQIARPGMDRHTRNRAEEAAMQRAAAAAANDAYAADEEHIDTRPATGRAMKDYSGGGYDMYGQGGGMAGQGGLGGALPPRQPQQGRGVPNTAYANDEQRAPRQPGPYMARPQRPAPQRPAVPDSHLRINIKAQPGTAVHITPGVQQPRQPAPVNRHERSPSVETEI